jgi:N-acetylglucosaminyl-diphospho-decaprenol L-rhamnosyltransferase
LIAVAVVSFETRELLARCLESLAGHEVWVVDNASDDGSADMVRERFAGVHLIASAENLGYGRAVNLVGARTDSPWLVAANADVAVRPGALEALVEAGERDPGAGILAPRLVRADGSVQHSIHPFPTVPVGLAHAVGAPGLGDRLALEGRTRLERERRVDWAHGALLAIRREAWDAVSGFDERRWMYAEDLDLCWRARRAGWATRYVPGAVVEHAVSAATAAAFGAGREDRAQAAAYAWMREARGPARTRAYALIGAGAALARRDRAWARRHLQGLRGGGDGIPAADSHVGDS